MEIIEYKDNPVHIVSVKKSGKEMRRKRREIERKAKRKGTQKVTEL